MLLGDFLLQEISLRSEQYDRCVVLEGAMTGLLVILGLVATWLVVGVLLVIPFADASHESCQPAEDDSWMTMT